MRLKAFCFLMPMAFLCHLCLCVTYGQKVLGTPRAYANGCDGTVLAVSTGDVDKNAWIVCSDRNNNTTYSEPGGSIFKTMNFLDRFYVVDEKGEYLHLYKYEEGIKDNKQRLKDNAVDYGWANKQMLLLWQRCIETDKKLSQKALPIITKNTLSGNLADYVKEGSKLRLFKDPGLTMEHENTIQMFQFLFVYKREGNSILVGKGSQTFYYRVESDLLGWISTDIAKIWGDRVCLEPNDDPESVEERKLAKVKTTLWNTKEQALAWQKTGVNKTVPLWDDDPMGKKWGAYRKRFPVLNYDDEQGIAGTGNITEIVDASGKKIIGVDDAVKVSEKASQQIQNIRQVNLVFVVDAGSGMQEYLESVVDAIRRVTVRHIEVPLNQFKYGVVVYRDYGDIDCNDNLSFAKEDLTPNASEIIDFINTQSQIKGCKTGNKAVNLGLSQALRMLSRDNNSRDQTNFIILLGGAAGNDYSDPKYSDKTISGMMADTKTNFCAFQVMQGTLDGFSFFVKRYADIMKAAANKSYQNRISSIAHSDNSPPRFNAARANTYFMDYPKTSDLQALISFAKSGGSLSADDITYELDSIIRYTEEDIERKIIPISTKVEGMGLKDIKLDPSIDRYFISIGDKLNKPDLIKKYAGKNYQFFIPGFASLNAGNLSYPVFKRVLFVSGEEFDELVNALRKLSLDAPESELRKKIYNVYISLLAAYMGDRKAREAVENRMTVDEVLFFVTGLHSLNPLLQYQVRDFENVKKVPDEKIRTLQDYLRKKYESVLAVRSDPDALLKQDWGVFYWIPEDYLP